MGSGNFLKCHPDRSSTEEIATFRTVMNASKIRLILIVVWAASLAGAYHFGKQSGGDVFGSEAGLQPSNNRAGGVAGATMIGNRSEASGTGDSAAGGEGGEAGTEVNVRALIAQVGAQLGAGPGMMYNPTAMMKAMAPMADLSESQVREALGEVEATMTNPQQKVMFFSLLLGRLAETDGPGAMAYIEENLADQGGYATGVTMSVISAWSRREPEAAWDWFMKNRDNESASVVVGFGQVAAVFSGIASKDIDLAFSRLDQVDDVEKTQAISGIAMSGAWDPEFRDQLLAKAGSLPADTRETLYQGMVGQWAMMDPDGALAWIDTLPDKERKPLLQQAGSMLLMSNPKRGAELMLESTSEQERPTTYSRIISQWSHRDPNGAGEWLNQQPQGPELDSARAAFARSVVKRDPVSAMEWAKTVEDETQRVHAVQQVYWQWKVKGAKAADSALDQSGLTGEQIEKLRKHIPLETTARSGGSILREP
jgi:hypothetical protein